MIEEFICKGCGEKLNKDMQSINVGYCFICNEFYMKKHVSELESKLAEIEKKYEDRKQFCTSEIRSLMEIINNLLEENDQLEQQLAEVKDSCDYYMKRSNDLVFEIEQYKKNKGGFK